MVIETRSPEETFALGEKLGREAKPGQIYTLNGDLGTGKNRFLPRALPPDLASQSR